MTTPDSPSSRRDFLHGRAARDALLRRLGADERPTDSPSGNSSPTAAGNLTAGTPEPAFTDPTQAPYLLRLARGAMACQFELIVNAGQYPHATEAGLAALDLLQELEQQMTTYRDSSELTYVNRHAASAPVPVEPRLYAVLRRAAEIHARTDGAFDITSGPLSQVWGFAARQGRVPETAALEAARSRVGGHLVQLDDERMSVHFQQVGVELNLGSIGKGYALDCCSALLEAAGVHDFLWHGGQSSVLARGSSASGQGWLVGVLDPLRPDRRLGEICLDNQALGTSGNNVQFFRYQGKRYGHILDPRTGWPAEGMLTATVVCSTAADADALATALYVLGPKRALEFCQRHPEVGAVLLFAGTQASSIECQVINLADGQWRPAAKWA